MILRIWHGFTKAKDADEYDRLLRMEILPGIHRIEGYRGAWLLRRAAGQEVEFVTITTWDSWERFAGLNHRGSMRFETQAVYPSFHRWHSVAMENTRLTTGRVAGK